MSGRRTIASGGHSRLRTLTMANSEESNAQAQKAWNTNAEFWDAQMAQGNQFFNVLVWPTVIKWLAPAAGDRLLDVACGNGLTSRRLAELGAHVTACDFSPEMLRRARARTDLHAVDYRLLDVTDAAALRQLGNYDGVLCNMALMDIAEIQPLMEALPSLLSPDGRFVFSLLHPCFNNPATVQMAELEDRSGTLVTTHSVKISRYMSPYTRVGAAVAGQPVAHPYFHRSFTALLAPAFQAGFVVDGFEECAFPPEVRGSSPLSWSGQFSEIPAIVVARLRAAR
jgi:2-polyprenyl-3-methyl-5-hydroxy-6-metoxy-1,4-benzoquinol methylase